MRVNEAGTWIRDSDASFELNEPDAYALEEALRLKEKHGGEVVVCCAGPARAAQVIREALGAGRRPRHPRRADAAAAAVQDAAAVAALLAGGRPGRRFDLVLTGLQSDDQGFGQVGVILAEALGMPHATIIMEVQAVDGALRVKRELEGGWFQWLALPLAGPADHPERHQPAPLRHAQGHHGGEEEGDPQGRRRLLSRGPCSSIVRVYLPEKGKQTQMIAGSTGRCRRALVTQLRDEARVI